MVRLIRPLAILLVALLSCCGTVSVSDADYAIQNSSDRRIREDTANLNAGRPLQHFGSEKRLRVAREDRLLNEMMNR